MSSVYSRVSRSQLGRLLIAALEEDVGSGDLTTEALVPRDLRAQAYLLVKEDAVLAGTEVLSEVFHLVDPCCEVSVSMADGCRVKPGDRPVAVTGPAWALLAGERTALNFVQKMSGIATASARLVAIAAPYGVRVNHIRKTTPLLRALEVYAVHVGGGHYNRFGLYDGVLIKDNHLAVVKDVKEAVAKARSCVPITVKIGLEVQDLSQLPVAIDARPDYIALDNMSVSEITEAVRQVDGRIPLDVTGGVNASNLEAICKTGVQMVGVGGITHSAPSVDMSIEIEV